MVFKNQKQLESFLMKQSRQALMKAQDRVYEIIKQFVYKFYTEFTPDEYIRTRRLLESLVQSRIVSDGKGYRAEVYFDVSQLDYEQGVMELKNTSEHGKYGWATWDGETVLRVAMESEVPHGGHTGGTAIWTTSKAKLDAEAINILINMLKAQGIPVKK